MTPDARERLRLAMLFIEEWSNWWSYALGVDDDAPMPKAEKEAAEQMAASLGARARDMVIDNRRFLASVQTEELRTTDNALTATSLAGSLRGAESSQSTIGAPVPRDHPMLVAWEAYKLTEDYANTKRWAVHPEHVDGSLWASFVRGWEQAFVRPPAIQSPHATYIPTDEDLANRRGDTTILSSERTK